MAIRTEALALAFSAMLRRDIGEEFETMLAQHRRSPDRLNGRTCVTHDYCDPNATMLDAWFAIFGRDLVIDDDDEMDVVGEAWNIAKAADFYAGV